MTRFIMLIGLPGSGKSTYVLNNIKENEVYLSSDEIREELYGNESIQDNPAKVFDLMYKRTIDALLNNQTVYYDATNINRKKRIHTLSQLKHKIKDLDCQGILFATPYEECLKRNQLRNRNVPEEAIKRMYMSFNVPSTREGFNNIKIIYPEDFNKDVIVIDRINALKRFNQETKHHSNTLGDHMYNAFTYLIKNYPKHTLRLRYATLLHDLGKPFTKSFYNSKGELTENAHYYSHDKVGAYEFILTVP